MPRLPTGPDPGPPAGRAAPPAGDPPGCTAGEASGPPAGPDPLPPTRPAEVSLAAFLLICAVSVLVIRPPRWPLLIMAQIVGAILVILLAYRIPGSRSRAPRILRLLLPLVLFPVLYKMTGWISAGLHVWILDGPLEKLEATVFGGQPSMFLSERMPWLFLSELLHACYFAYYVILPSLPVALALEGREREAASVVFTMAACFYILELFYIWLPVTSPLYKYPPITGELAGGFFYRLNHAVSARGGVLGGAFPSSHAALSSLVLLLSWRFDRRIFGVLLLPVAGVLFATVYCRYHFALDIVAGVVVAGAVFVFVRSATVPGREIRSRSPSGRRGVSLSCTGS